MKHLEAAQVSVTYRRRVVVRDVSVTVLPGQVIALVGPNGSGKSSLLRCLAGLQSASAGTIRLDGEPLTTYSSRRLSRRVAYVPQENPMPYDFTVAEMVALAGSDAGAQAEALRTMEVTGLAQRSVTTLSGGERQRTAIARALSQNTDYLLLDEPTAHLDLKHQYLLARVLRRRAVEQGTGVLAVLHDLNLAASCAHRMLILSEGRLVAEGPPTEVLTPQTLRAVYQIQPTLITGEPGVPPFIAPPPDAALGTSDLTSS